MCFFLAYYRKAEICVREMRHIHSCIQTNRPRSRLTVSAKTRSFHHLNFEFCLSNTKMKKRINVGYLCAQTCVFISARTFLLSDYFLCTSIYFHITSCITFTVLCPNIGNIRKNKGTYCPPSTCVQQ